jgi:hypothetical protein
VTGSEEIGKLLRKTVELQLVVGLDLKTAATVMAGSYSDVFNP